MVELGTHDELMAAGGRYRTMFDLQASRFGRRRRDGRGDATMSSTDDLPPALPAMWRALKRGYEAEPRLLVVAFWLVAAGGAARRAAGALAQAARRRRARRTTARLVMAAAVGLGVSAAATWFLRVISDRTQRRFRDRLTIALESHVARLQASVATIEHHERPEYLDRLAVLRNQVFVLDHMYMSLFSTCGWILRLGVTAGAADVDPPGAGAARRLRAADGAHVDAGGRASSAPPKSGRAGEPAGAASVRSSPRPRRPARRCA